MATSIGIDLGTCYTTAALINKNELQIIKNSSERKTLNCIAFKDTNREIGESLKAKIRTNYNKIIFDSKVFIGSNSNDINHLRYPFTIVPNVYKPTLKIDPQEREFHPEEITSIILQQIKESAQKQLGTIVDSAMISVPSSFSDSQRQATINAAHMAGFKSISLINDNTAVAIAYAYDKNINRPKRLFVYNLGGFYLNLSIVHINNGIIEVLAADSYAELGGKMFEYKMVEYLLKNLAANNLFSNKKVMQTLLTECEKAKIHLSNSLESYHEIESLFEDNKDFNFKFNRKDFEDINNDLFKETIEHCDAMFQSTGLNKEDIDEVLLIGGSSRIPKIQSLLTDFFNGKELNKTMNASESVVYGTAIQAAFLSGDYKLKTNNGFKYLDIVSLKYSLRVLDETNEELLELLIRPLVEIPIVQSAFIKKPLLNNSLLFELYENEKRIFQYKYNPCEVDQIELSLIVHNDGLVNVDLDKYYTNCFKVKKFHLLKNKIHCLHYNEIKRLKNESKNYQDYVKVENEKIAKRNFIESKCYGLKKELEALNNKTQIYDDIQERLDDLLKKIGSENLIQNANEEELLLEEIVEQFEQLKKKLWKPKNGKTLGILVSCHL